MQHGLFDSATPLYLHRDARKITLPLHEVQLARIFSMEASPTWLVNSSPNNNLDIWLFGTLNIAIVRRDKHYGSLIDIDARKRAAEIFVP